MIQHHTASQPLPNSGLKKKKKGKMEEEVFLMMIIVVCVRGAQAYLGDIVGSIADSTIKGI